MVIEGRYQIFAGNEFVFVKNAVMGNVVFALLLHTWANTARCDFSSVQYGNKNKLCPWMSPTQNTINST